MVLENAYNGLQSIVTTMKEACTYDSGLRVSENVEKKTTKKRKLKRKAAIHYFCDKIPRKYAKLNPFASRCGETASKMKPLYNVT